MKRLLPPLGLIMALLAPSAARAGMVTAHDLRVTLQPDQHSLTGVSTLSFKNSGNDSARFRLNSGCSVSALTIDGTDTPHSFTEGTLAFRFLRDPARERSEAVVRYRCRFNDALPEQYAGSEDPTYGVDGVIAPGGAFLSSTVGWYPRPEEDLPPMRVTVTAPAGMEAITAGRRLEHVTRGGETVSSWEILQPLPAIALSAGPYRIEERTVDNIPLYTYFYPDNTGLASRYLDAAGTYLSDYRKKFGPYPFPKFAVVDNFFPTGYGFPSYTLIGSSVLRLPFIVTTSLPHEIAHNWWGNGVDVDPLQGNWSEGLVTYLADYVQESGTSPAAAAGYRFRLLAEFAAVVPPERDFPLRKFQSRTDAVSRAIGYGKGAMVFHMVHNLVGDEAFYGGLKELVKEKLFQPAGWSDFGRVFSRTSGKDVTAFLDQWLSRPGGARLRLEKVERKRSDDGWLVRGTVVQEGVPYEMPVTVRVDTAAGSQDLNLAVSGEETPFTLNLPQEPSRVIIDPDYHLFRQLDRNEIPVTINRLKGARSLRVVVTDNCRADREALRHLVTSLGHPTAQLSPEGVATEGEDLIYCGFPGRAELPRLPAGVIPAKGSFTVDGTRWQDGGSSLFLTLGGSGDTRMVGLFLPLSREAAGDVAAKIGHYGKYSYLVFEKGKNRVKGVFPAGTGRGTHTF